MFRIDHSTAVAVKPSPGEAGTPGFFTEGDPLGGIAPTVVTQAWANGIQEELISILTAAGIEPDKTATNQVLLALQAMGLKIATTAQAQALTNDTTIITPKKLADAFMGSNQNLNEGAVTGFQKLPGGFCEQWGTSVTSAPPGNAATVTFPIAYSSLLSVHVTRSATTASQDTNSFALAASNTSFVARHFVGSASFFWRAIGKL